MPDDDKALSPDQEARLPGLANLDDESVELLAEILVLVRPYADAPVKLERVLRAEVDALDFTLSEDEIQELLWQARGGVR